MQNVVHFVKCSLNMSHMTPSVLLFIQPNATLWNVHHSIYSNVFIFYEYPLLLSHLNVKVRE